jgi:hypothetical protein
MSREGKIHFEEGIRQPGYELPDQKRPNNIGLYEYETDRI